MAAGPNPFPYSIIEGTGTGFAIGLLGSSPWHFIRGPSGMRLSYLAMNAPRTGATFAIWSGLFDAMSGGLGHIRHKEDPWNNIWAGALTSGLLSLRMGLRSTSTQFLIGGALLAGFEGLNVMNQRMLPMLEAQTRLSEPPKDYPHLVLPPQGSLSDQAEAESRWFEGWFSNKKGGKKGNEEGGTRVLESFNTSPPAMPNFDYQ